MKKLIILTLLMVSILGYSQPIDGTKDYNAVWEEYRVDSILTVMFRWKGMQLAKERIELKYATQTLESNDMLIANFKDALDLYKSQVFSLNSVLIEREEEIIRLKKTTESLNGDLDVVGKQLRKEKAKKWLIGGGAVVVGVGI